MLVFLTTFPVTLGESQVKHGILNHGKIQKVKISGQPRCEVENIAKELAR